MTPRFARFPSAADGRYNIPPAVRESLLVLVRHVERQGAALEELEDEVRRLRRDRGGPPGPSTAALARQAQAAEQKLQRLEIQACDSLQHCAALRSGQKSLSSRVERLERGGRSAAALERLNGPAEASGGDFGAGALEGRLDGLQSRLNRYIHGEGKGWKEALRESRASIQMVEEQLREELGALREEVSVALRRSSKLQRPDTSGSGLGSPEPSPLAGSSFVIHRAQGGGGGGGGSGGGGGGGGDGTDSPSNSQLRHQVDSVGGAVLQLQSEMTALRESLGGLDALGVVQMPNPGGQSPMLAFSPQPGGVAGSAARTGDASRMQNSITLLSQVNMHSVQIESVIGTTTLNRQRIEDLSQRQLGLGQIDNSLADHGHKIRRLEEKTADIMQNTYRRVDDHATAISRLSKGIQDNMQDRPTIMHVRHLIANSLAEDRLRIIEKMAELQDEIANVERRFRNLLKKQGGGGGFTHETGAGPQVGEPEAPEAEVTATSFSAVDCEGLHETKTALEALQAEVLGLKQRISLTEGLPADIGARLEESFTKIEKTRLSCLQLEEAASCMVDRNLLESTVREVLQGELDRRAEEGLKEVRKQGAALDQLFQALRSKVSLSDIDSLIEWKIKSALVKADTPSQHFLDKVRKSILQDIAAKTAHQTLVAQKSEMDKPAETKPAR